MGRPKTSPDGFDYHTRMGWYLSLGWTQTRAAAYQLAGGKCSRCEESTSRIEVHHIVDPFPSRSIELLLRFDNLEVVCSRCHRREHKYKGATTVCATCGAIVRHAPSKTGKRRFCSMACRDRHPDFRHGPDRICPEPGCGRSFSPHGEQVRCSIACSSAYIGRLRRAGRPHFMCPSCQKDFTIPPSLAKRPRLRGPFCSKACDIADRCGRPSPIGRVDAPINAGANPRQAAKDLAPDGRLPLAEGVAPRS